MGTEAPSHCWWECKRAQPLWTCGGSSGNGGWSDHVPRPSPLRGSTPKTWKPQSAKISVPQWSSQRCSQWPSRGSGPSALGRRRAGAASTPRSATRPSDRVTGGHLRPLLLGLPWPGHHIQDTPAPSRGSVKCARVCFPQSLEVTMLLVKVTKYGRSLCCAQGLLL